MVSMTAKVEPNEFNVITAELQRRTTELDSRERDINARALDANTGREFFYSTYLLSVLLALLLVLIVTNYIMDYLRNRRSFARV